MDFQFPQYIWVLFLAAIVATSVAYAVWQRRQASGAHALVVCLFAYAEWSLTYALSIASPTLDGQLFWANLTYIGICTATAGWFLFAIEYTGVVSLIKRWNVLILVPVPLLTLAVIWTNDWHRLFRTSAGLQQVDGFVWLDVELGPAFLAHTLYSYSLLLAGAFLIIRSFLRSESLYRRQMISLVAGVLLPIGFNALYVFQLIPITHVDITPLMFTLSGVIIGWNLLRYRLLEIVPIARGTVFENMGDAVFVFDPQVRVIDVNPAGAQLLERQPDELIGRFAVDVMANHRALLDQYRGVRQARSEIEVLVGGETRSFDLRLSALYDWRKQFTGTVVVLHDITERKQVETALQMQNDQLAALVNDNARLFAELQQELAERYQAEVALQQAKEAAEVASRAKTRFLANMSHELRTPLTAILGYTELLLLDAQRKQLHSMSQDLEQVWQSGQHLLTLINDVLDLTRIEADRFELLPERFAVVPMVSNLIRTLRPLAEQRGNSFEVLADPDPGVMYSDPTRVQQVLLNLLGNATKFTENGHITLRITRHYAAEVGSAVDLIAFEVTDTGIGMTPEQMQRLFQDFSQVDDTFSRKQGGSGLGLAISRRLCRLMGGDITVTSELGKGSSFRATLRAELARVVPAAAVVAEEAV
jgi:PAS domain S-box-containing protein